MLLCPRCQRTNPKEAVFCHFDGAELRPVHGREETQSPRLPHDFVFPSGKRCHSFDELASACQEEWNAARDLLKQGTFAQFLASVGRMDLAQAAKEAKNQADPDVALDTFIGALPAKIEARPRLDLNPRRLNFGTLHVGEARQVRLTVINQGKGLLHGTLSVAEGHSWLRLNHDGKANGQCLIKTASEQAIVLRIDTKGLVAPHKYSAKLTVITNGGIVEVPVRLDLAVQPFAMAPFQGAGSPREMAERMRTQPKPAVPLLENGEVARWFAVNGWTYPVLGPTAKGVAAVQQFFEGMGLSKPPPLELSASVVQIRCLPGDSVQEQIIVRTEAKKWVYARAESDAAWLRITSPNISGPQQANLTFEVDSHDLAPDRAHEANIRIVANAAQILTAQVRVEFQRPAAPPVKASVARPFLVGAMAGLVFRLLLAIPGDLYARLLMAETGKGTAGTFASWLQSPVLGDAFLKHFVLATWWLGAVAGAVLLWRRGSRIIDALYGLIAGAMAGLAGSATFACLLPGLDSLPRFVWYEIGKATGLLNSSGYGFLWTILWIILATVCWAMLGAVAGFVLGSMGRAGATVLAGLGEFVSRALRLCGLKRAAAHFPLQ